MTEVAVEGDGEGCLAVSWTVDGGDTGVDVAVGPTPDHVDHRHAVAVPAGQTATRLSGLGPGRHYVSVSPTGGGSAIVAAERLVALEGTMNLRDLGGYRGIGGRQVRWGRVFRSDALHALTAGDLAVFGRLGLRVVYDLRRQVERDRQPTVRLAEDVRSVVLPIGGDPDDTNQPELIDQILAGEVVEADDEFMAGEYRRMVDDAAPHFGELLTRLTDPDGLPALFHCTAGKDRTGVAAALLLSTLGVDEDVVLDDYELSTRYRSARRIEELRPALEAKGVDVEKVRPFLSARRPVLEATLAHLRDAHGGVERYLTGPAGMAGGTLDELRSLLLCEEPTA